MSSIFVYGDPCNDQFVLFWREFAGKKLSIGDRVNTDLPLKLGV